MSLYKIKTQQIQNTKWQPTYQLIQNTPQSSGTVEVSEPTEFDNYFETKDEAELYATNYLINELGIKKEKIIYE